MTYKRSICLEKIKKMIQNKSKYECCGCGACASACSQSAITMQPDSLGFLYPYVDKEKCINCGLCEKLCQFSDNYNRYDNYEAPIVTAARLKNEDDLLHSQSGGAFFMLAKNFIRHGGVVYGADFDEHLVVVHKRVSTIPDLQSLRLSKYSQSNLSGVFQLIKQDLQDGVKVLFSGTSCQVAAIRSYIPNRLSEKLYTIDIVCHGAPSPYIWKQYLSYIENKYKSKVLYARFRDKQFGWARHQQQSFDLADGRTVYGKTSNNLFFGLYSIRECCSQCPFTNTRRIGDISLGDYWGWESCPELKDKFSDNKGISLLMINSDKGDFLLEDSETEAVIIHTTTDSYLQPRLKRPTLLNDNRDAFISDFNRKGFLYVAKKYGDLGWRWRVHLLKERLKKTIKIITK